MVEIEQGAVRSMMRMRVNINGFPSTAGGVQLLASLSRFAHYGAELLATRSDTPEARLAQRSIAGVTVVMLCMWRKASGYKFEFLRHGWRSV